MAKRDNIVDSLVMAGGARHAEVKLALMGLGAVDALKSGKLTPAQAWDHLFNLDNYEAIKRHHLNRDLRSLFEWGMELEDVAELVPAAMAESFVAITKLAQRLIWRATKNEVGRKNRGDSRLAKSA